MDGERLFELDIANCQPLLLGLLARHNPQPDTQPTTNTDTTYSICRAFLTDQNITNYIELCERGELYEHLKRRCHGRLTLRDPKLVVIRADKSPHETDSTKAIEELYLKQKVG